LTWLARLLRQAQVRICVRPRHFDNHHQNPSTDEKLKRLTSSDTKVFSQLFFKYFDCISWHYQLFCARFCDEKDESSAENNAIFAKVTNFYTFRIFLNIVVRANKLCLWYIFLLQVPYHAFSKGIRESYIINQHHVHNDEYHPERLNAII
jgi:hypothetical protein